MGVAFLTQGLVAYINANLRMPIRVMVMGSAISIAGIFFWRLLFSAFAFPGLEITVHPQRNDYAVTGDTLEFAQNRPSMFGFTVMSPCPSRLRRSSLTVGWASSTSWSGCGSP